MQIARRLSFKVCFVAAVLAVSPASAAAQGSWAPTTSMPSGRAGHSAAVLNGRIHVVGGLTADGCSSRHVAYDPGTATWTVLAPMPTAREHAGAAVLNGLLYVVGGDTGCSSYGAALEVYDPVTDQWTSLAPMPTPRGTLGVAALDGHIYAVGGVNGVKVNAVEAYDPVTNHWSTKAPLPDVDWGMGIGVIDGMLYTAGGTTDVAFNGVWAYNPSTNTWIDKAAPLSVPRVFVASAVLDGELYILGGLTPDSAFSAAAERYNPVTNTWTIVTSLPAARDEFAAVGLGANVFSIGGYDGAYNADVQVFTDEAASPTATDIVSALIAATVVDHFQQGTNLLQAVLRSIGAGNTGSACGQLTAFVNQVEAQAGKRLTTIEAARLAASANDARVALGCARPAANYDASGTWHGTIGPHNGPFFEFDVILSQDSNGNITGVPAEEGDSSVLVLTYRSRAGRAITYAVNITNPRTCQAMTGSARLDTSTHTLTANVSGTTDRCDRTTSTMTLHQVE